MLHLLDYHGVENEFNVPYELTQNGIAEVIGTKRNYVSSSIKKLIAKGYVRECVGRVKRAKRMQKYALLTKEGKEYIGRLKKKLSDRQITLKQPNGTSRMMKLKYIIPYMDKKEICLDATELDIYKMMSKNGTLDVGRLNEIRKMQFVDTIL